LCTAGKKRDRQPARYGDRHAGKTGARTDRSGGRDTAARGTYRRPRGSFWRRCSSDGHMEPDGADRRKPDRGAGVDRGTRLNHGSPPWRRARGRRLWQPGYFHRRAGNMTAAPVESDPVITEIVRNGVIAITEEMKSNLMRTAYNMIIYEALDFTVGLFTPKGETISIGLGLPMFIRGMAETIKAKLEHYGAENIHPGDILLTNDAYITGSHLNHLTFTQPIFQ
ncbi:unnamed protein product, partial [Discosporangium mesarthrocarpum]